jgi:hypothetical protein
MIATTFTGNVPHYDIIASDATGRHLAVQVKAIRKGSWQLNLTSFAGVSFRGKKQIIEGPTRPPVERLVCVFVMLKEDRRDRFFILDWRDLQKIVIATHSEYLQKHGGIRPKKPESLHLALKPASVERFEDNWKLIERRLGSRS